MNVGFVGLGTMGSAAVRTILQAGNGVVGYDLNQESVHALSAEGMTPASSVSEVGAQEVILISVPGPPQVLSIVEELSSSIRAGSVVADISSVDPVTSQRAAKMLKDTGAGYLDAPVLGRPNSVGKWILPTGGDARAFETVRPILEVIAVRAVHVGPSGSGSAIKLLNNMMVGALNATISEAFALAPHVGVAPEVLYDVITGSKAPTNNLLFQVKGKKILEGDYSPTFKLDLLAKDNDLCLRMARDVGIPLFVAQTVDGLNKLAQHDGLGGQDNCVLQKYLADRYAKPQGKE